VSGTPAARYFENGKFWQTVGTEHMASNTHFAAVVFPWTYSLDDTAIIAAVKAATHSVSDVLICAAPSGPSALLQSR
jgi:hypothetical protein